MESVGEVKIENFNEAYEMVDVLKKMNDDIAKASSESDKTIQTSFVEQ